MTRTNYVTDQYGKWHISTSDWPLEYQTQITKCGQSFKPKNIHLANDRTERPPYAAGDDLCGTCHATISGPPIHWEAGDSLAAQVAFIKHPFQGPDLFGNKTLKIWNEGTHSNSWTPFRITPWKPSKSKTPNAHVEMSQRVFYSAEGFRFTFWALAPAQPGVRNRMLTGQNTEFVWLILDGTNGRGVHRALVDKETDEVHWWDKTAEYYMSGCEEVTAS